MENSHPGPFIQLDPVYKAGVVLVYPGLVRTNLGYQEGYFVVFDEEAHFRTAKHEATAFADRVALRKQQ